MGKIKIEDDQTYVENVVNLNAVTTATDGSAVDMKWYSKGRVWTEVTSNSGAVTVKVEGSPSGLFTGEEVLLKSTTYNAENRNDVFNILYPLPFIRTTTSTHSNATVKTTITARS